MQVVQKSPDYIFNHLTKLIPREIKDDRHNTGFFLKGELRGNVAEPWRLPIIDSFRAEGNEKCYYLNEVTFVYSVDSKNLPQSVSVIGTFGNLYEPIPLQQVENSIYFSVTCIVPKGEVHYYKFLVNGESTLDPINPQVKVLDNGSTWSRFFTQCCTVPVSFERWEWVLLERLTDHILPFRTTEGSRFLNMYYHHLDKNSKETLFSRAYLLDQSVGVVNFIDKILAREEYHRLRDYKICLEIVDQVLRKRNPFQEPSDMSREMFVALYGQMASGQVSGWDYARYGNPRFFLQLLRRHTLTGAFSHPKYGGNAECAGWAFLGERYRDKKGKTLFNWQLALEKPIGLSEEYHG